MAKNREGRFLVSETDDGRFVAVATTAPYFCLRAESEKAVLDKVKSAVTFCQSRTTKAAGVKISAVSQTVTSVNGGTSYSLNDILEAA